MTKYKKLFLAIFIVTWTRQVAIPSMIDEKSEQQEFPTQKEADKFALKKSGERYVGNVKVWEMIKKTTILPEKR